MEEKKYLNMFKLYLALLVIAGAIVCLPLGGSAQEEGAGQEEGAEEEGGPKLTREAQQALVDAQDFYQAEDFSQARKILLDFLASDPEKIPEILYLMLGHCWYQEEEIKEAYKVWKEGHEAFPENEELFRYYSYAAYESGNVLEAAGLFEEFYDFMEEKDVQFLLQSAVCYYSEGELEEAKRVFRRMINLPGEPENQWLEYLIQICFEQENLSETEENILMALDYYPANAKYWDWLYRVRMAKEDYLGGTSALEIQYHIEPPEKKDSWRQLTDLYNYLNAPLRVADKLPKSFDNDVEDDRHIQVARAYASALRIDKAVEYLDSVLKKKKTSQLLLEKGRILYNDRRNKEAIEALDDCIEFDPQEGYAYMLKGFAAWDLEDWDLAKEAFQQAKNIPEYKGQAVNAMSYINDLEEARKE